jgi:hypothetical protein
MIAQQIRQQQRQEQENRDLQMAQQLANQLDPLQPAVPTVNQPAMEGLPRFMAEEQTYPKGPTGWDWQSLPTSSVQTPAPPTELKQASMPGSYNPNWDNLGPWSRSPFSTPAPLPSNGFPVDGGHTLDFYRQSPPKPVMQTFGHISPLRNQFQNPGLQNAFRTSPLSRPEFNARDWKLGGSSMSNIIEQTSRFDYGTGLDGFGRPLPNRLANVLYDDDDASPMTGTELQDLLKNIRPEIDIPKHNQGVGPPGLKCPLYRHQEVALTWMKQMEDGTNKGGILADDMGLGKTISTLALMLANQATSRPKASCSNLII